MPSHEPDPLPVHETKALLLLSVLTCRCLHGNQRAKPPLSLPDLLLTCFHSYLFTDGTAH